ncbi:MAG: branched-chain amino acid ABC transporter permease, partial [Burkholderiales bacterium]
MKTSWRDWAACVIWLGAGSIALAFANDYHALVLGTVACTAIVGVGLNVLLGLAGQTSLGHAAFYAIGAYACTLLTMRAGLPWLVALPVAALITGIAGALLSLPALRVRGPYLAMVTIAFGYFVEQAIAEWKSLTGGWNGIMNIPQPAFFGDQPLPWHLALVALVVSGLLIPAFAMFSRSDRGIVMRATRDAEVAASTLGANLMMVRALAFGISAALTGLAGGLFATLNGFISPESFPFSQSISFLLMVMIGGVGQASGPLVGALVVVLLPEALSTLAEYR